jgi:hypothetical protein
MRFFDAVGDEWMTKRLLHSTSTKLRIVEKMGRKAALGLCVFMLQRYFGVGRRLRG